MFDDAKDVEIISLDEATVSKLFDMYRTISAMGIIDSDTRFGSKNVPFREKPNTRNGIYVRNDSGFAVPPYGLMQATGTVDVSNSFNYVKVKRPIDSTLMRSPLLLNGPREIEVDGYGVAQNGPVFQLLHDGGTYAEGDRLGAKTGTFTATFGALYAVVGPDDIGTNIVRVMFDTSMMYGKTKSGGLTAGTPGNVYVYDASGTLTSKEYLAETKVTDISGDAEIALFPTCGRLFASRIC